MAWSLVNCLHLASTLAVERTDCAGEYRETHLADEDVAQRLSVTQPAASRAPSSEGRPMGYAVVYGAGHRRDVTGM